MTNAELIREVARRGPLQIRVLCPRPGKGHLVGNFTLSASDGQLLMRLEHSKNEVQRRLKQKGGVLSAYVHVPLTGGVDLPRCKPSCEYQGHRQELEFARELAEFALRQPDPRHATYTLVS